MGSHKVVQLVNGFGIFQALDLVVAPLGGTESIFISKASGVESVGARLIMYNLAGREVGGWPLPRWKGPCSGVAVDPQASVAYVASIQTGEIFKVDLLKPGSTGVPFTSLSEAEALGPIIFDRSRGRLLVGDGSRGTIFSVATDSGRSEILTKGLGEPSALLLDAKEEQLFIADASGRRVWIFDLKSNRKVAKEVAKARVFIESKELNEPSGLALTGDGDLLVSDSRGRALFQVSKEGKIVYTHRF
jgi:hypothetical protein